VISCGGEVEPLRVQMGWGFVASVTSATMGLAEPCITSSASCVAGAPGQLAWIAAQDGTAIGLGTGMGDGDALGDGLGEAARDGLAEGLGECEGEGLERATTGPFGVQAATATRSPTSTHPLLT